MISRSSAWFPLALLLVLLASWVGRPSKQPTSYEPQWEATAAATSPAQASPSSGTPRSASADEPGEQATPAESPAEPDPGSYSAGYESGSATSRTPSSTSTYDTSGQGGTDAPSWQSEPAGGSSGTGADYGTGSADYGTGDDDGTGGEASTQDDTGYGAPDYSGTEGTGSDTGTSSWDYSSEDASTYPSYEAETEGETTAPTATVAAYTFRLFDGFERGNQWAVESAADDAKLSVVADRASQGEQALRAAFKAYGKGNFELRREVSLDLSGARAFLVDVYNDAGPLELRLGFRAGFDTTLFTCPPRPIQAGWNRDVEFRLADFTSASAGAYGTSWDWNRDRVSRISLIFGEKGQKEGTVYIDNLRFDRPAEELGLTTKPVIDQVAASARAVERYETLELTVDFQADYQDYFDRSEVDLRATFLSPSGESREVHGFVYDTDEAGQPVWKIRFTPDQVGQWRYDVTVEDAGGTATSQTLPFHCQHKADRRGFIRIARDDPRYFEFDDGSFYYPLGQNVCWASNFTRFLQRIEDYGGNYVRIWLCPWSLRLEEPLEPGKYDLRTAKALDDLLDQCLRRGIYVQLVFRHHGMHDGEWDNNPYNAANGGPCQWPGDFFTLPAAKDLHKRFLDYVVARWGHSPAVFAWELWNEVDLARADRDSDVVDWHREMAAYLKKIDVHRHLVTTSVSNSSRCFQLFELADIDFVPVHFYAPDAAKHIHDSYVRYRKLRKPVFIGEFSRGHKPSDDLHDTEGVQLHAALWLAFCTPLAGNAMPWWWDTYIEKNDLYHHWAALAEFARGVDRRGRDYQVVRERVAVGKDAWANVQGLVCPSQAFLWVYDEGRIQRPEHAGRPLLYAERRVKLEGMLGGAFRVEVWDTHEGKVVQRSTVETDDGGLVVTLPSCTRDIAVKVVSEEAERPRVVWQE
ncbi:MAG: DUF5060 domain-containing protein [Candidatus Brocadiia bacterium]